MADQDLGICGSTAVDPVLAFAHQKGQTLCGVRMLQQHMTLFIAKMWHINHGGRIIGQQAHNVAGFMPHKAFAQPQHGQRANEAKRVDFFVPFHIQLDRAAQGPSPRKCDITAGDAGHVMA